jgi:hypothetical protein
MDYPLVRHEVAVEKINPFRVSPKLGENHNRYEKEFREIFR